jgi:hypothetical protein
MAKTKDVEYKGRKFRLGLPSARDGNWIINMMLANQHLAPANYDRIEKLLLNKVEYLRNTDGLDMPLKMYFNGDFLIPDLEIDSDELNFLFLEALKFLADPTLQRLVAQQKAEEEKERQALVTGQPSSQTASTGTSGGQ